MREFVTFVVMLRDGDVTLVRGGFVAMVGVARRIAPRDTPATLSAATAWKTSGARHAVKNNLKPFIP